MNRWKIENNIGKYTSTDGFTIVEEIKLINDNDGYITTENKHIHIDKITNLTQVAKAMRELGEELQRHDMSAFTFRHCRWCGELYPLKNKKSDFCCPNDKLKMHRLKKEIETKLNKLTSKDPENQLPDTFFVESANKWKISFSDCDAEITINGDTVNLYLVDDLTEDIAGIFSERFEFHAYEDAKIVALYSKTLEIPIWRFIAIFIWLLEY